LKFAVDRMLGTLAKWLRLLGYDTTFNKDFHIREFSENSIQEKRMIVTKNSRLSEFISPDYYYLVQGKRLSDQLREVIKEFNLDFESRLFTRCILCNAEVTNIDKVNVKGKVPEYIYESKNEFFICNRCDRIFWEGSHHKNVLKKLRNLF